MLFHVISVCTAEKRGREFAQRTRVKYYLKIKKKYILEIKKYVCKKLRIFFIISSAVIHQFQTNVLCNAGEVRHIGFRDKGTSVISLATSPATTAAMFNMRKTECMVISSIKGRCQKYPKQRQSLFINYLPRKVALLWIPPHHTHKKKNQRGGGQADIIYFFHFEYFKNYAKNEKSEIIRNFNCILLIFPIFFEF